MFVTRSRYEQVTKECSKQLDEIQFLRDQYSREKREKEKLEKTVEQLYHDAEINAEAKSKLSERLNEASVQISELQQETQGMRAKVDLVEYLHPAPEDENDRALYMARIAGWFNGGLRDYIKYLLSNLKSEISRFPLTERETDFFRSGINVCHLLLEWGDEAIAEHYANIRGEKNAENVFDVETDEENASVENIKKAVVNN